MSITISIEDAASNMAVTIKNLISEGYKTADEYNYEHHAISRAQINLAHQALCAYNLAVAGCLPKPRG